MRDPIQIKILEREAQAAYIRNLYTTLPREPITVFEFEEMKKQGTLMIYLGKLYAIQIAIAQDIERVKHEISANNTQRT